MNYGIVKRLVSFTATNYYVWIVLDDNMTIIKWKVVLTMLNQWAMLWVGLNEGNVLLHIVNWDSPQTMYKMENNA